jgi:glycerol uptake facilitator protein
VARQPITRPAYATIQERFLAELIGTFLLTFVGGAAVTAEALLLHVGNLPGNPSGVLIFAFAHGLALFVIVSAFGRVSGAHVNPAVTLALASVQRFPWEDVLPYLLAQFIGATLGAAAILLPYGTALVQVTRLGAPGLNTGISIWQGLASEALGAFILVTAVIATAVDERATPGWAGLAIGMALAAGILALGYVSSGSFNPARTFGPDLISMFFGAQVDWLAYLVSYLVGPILGGVIAVFVYRFVARLPRARR